MSLASTGDWVRLGHFLRPVPLGDLRGAPFVFSSAAAGARSLVIQGASTAVNLLSEVQDFAAATWTPLNGGTVTSNVSTRPSSATMAADQLTDDSAVVVEGLGQDVAISNDTATYTGSIYVKVTSGGTSKTFSSELVMTGGTQVSSILRVNTDTGAILSGTGTVTSVDSGTWWRLSHALTNNASGNAVFSFRIYPARGQHNSAATDVTAMGSAVIWGAQVEPGAALSSLSQPDLSPGDLLSVGGQLVQVAYPGVAQSTAPTLAVPLALPLRSAVTAGALVTWDRPTATFQLLGDASGLSYLPGRYQDAINLQFVEAF